MSPRDSNPITGRRSEGTRLKGGGTSPSRTRSDCGVCEGQLLVQGTFSAVLDRLQRHPSNIYRSEG
jgi:hypothetical protein